MCKYILYYIYGILIWLWFFLSLLPNSDDLPNAQRVIIELGNKDGCHGLIQGGAIHVDSGSYWQHEASDALVHPVVLLHTLKCHRQCG